MLEKIGLLVLAIVPPLLILKYYLNKDKAKPEPTGLIVKVFIAGCFLVIPALIIEFILTIFFGFGTGNFLLPAIILKSFIIAGFVEEWLKRYTVKKVAYNTPYFDEVFDGILYAIVASLGFAMIENIFYVLDGGLTTGLIRAITALPLHAIAAGIMGYYLGKAKFAETPLQELQLFRKGLFRAVIYHGLYDFIVFSGALISSLFFIALPIILIFGFVHLRKLINQALYEDKIMGRQIVSDDEDIELIYDNNNLSE